MIIHIQSPPVMEREVQPKVNNGFPSRWHQWCCNHFGHRFSNIDMLTLLIKIRSGLYWSTITCRRCRRSFDVDDLRVKEVEKCPSK